MDIFKNKKILVCGGTGSIGAEIVRQLLKYKPKQIRVFARDETKHQELLSSLGNPPNIRPLIGDIRDKERLKLAIEDIEIVFNAAALKHVTLGEYNPFETIKTNVFGVQNVIDLSLEQNVEKVISISTDKAVEPNNTLGATKLLAEKLIISANFYKGHKRTQLFSVRFGNVLGSRNSLLPILRTQIQSNKQITITDPKMTRFVMSTSEAVSLVFKATNLSQGGEVFILKMPSVYIGDLIETYIEEFKKKYYINEKTRFKVIGIQPGEKIHEKLLANTETRETFENGELFVMIPNLLKRNYKSYKGSGLKPISEHIEYNSETARKLKRDEIRSILLRDNLL